MKIIFNFQFYIKNENWFLRRPSKDLEKQDWENRCQWESLGVSPGKESAETRPKFPKNSALFIQFLI